MELSRQEYPALLRSLSPNQAVSVLDERVKLIGKINTDIADWLAERRRVEELYVQGLRKLAGRRPHDAAAELGVFRTPWQSIVSSMQSLAESHNILAAKMESDVERPLKDFQSKNREMQGISTIQGNLAAVAKDLDGAQKRAQKLAAGKSSANKVANATSDVDSANQAWDSQAPFVFEQLQALDESRVNHLRDVLTQFETHEVDLVERNRITAESCLNALLNVNTADEISTFVAQNAGGDQNVSRRLASRSATTGSSIADPPPASILAATPPPTLTPSRERARREDERPSPFSTASRAGTAPPQKSSFGGLRRLGTVLGGRSNKGVKGMDRAPSPEKRSRPMRNPLRRGPSSHQNMETIPSPPSSLSNLPHSPRRQEAPLIQTASQSTERPRSQERRLLNDQVNGDTIQPAPTGLSTLPGMPNGISSAANRDLATVQETQAAPPPGPAPGKMAERDAEGYSVPSSAVDDITRAQQEAVAAGETGQSQFKLDIRPEPIKEDPDAQSAFSSVANTLRAQASQVATPRKPGTSLESAGLGGSQGPSAPPFNLGGVPPLPLDAQRGSDAQSIRSAHSVSSLASTAVTHPQMRQPGLNASIVETVTATFEKSEVVKAVVIGELALQHNPSETTSQSGSESVRLENFPVLEKVAPNPTFISQTPSRSGEYSVNVSQVSRPSVAFKYQVHLEDSSLAAHAPVSIIPSWKIQPTQASVILSYAFNPAFSSPAKRSVSLKNVVVFISVENTKALSCQSKPQGIFSKERSLIYWKLGDMTLDGYAEAPQKLLARFNTEGEANPGNVEMRWEISGEAAAGLGSGLSLSQMSSREEGGSDPFADEGTSSNAAGAWKEVPLHRKLISGKYIAN
ncbi:MAG: hypothetical protein ASARMPRED_003840 [Alectoria sarmentosa]|nr:MAG: hypothetical protein ASARMPRED_003840 [Alectoria sarmentosa]